MTTRSAIIGTSGLAQGLPQPRPAIVRGEGIYLWDDRGRRYIDGSGGQSAATAIGHGVREVAEAMAAQALRVAEVPKHYFTNPAQEELARMVADRAPGDLKRVWFVSGGSEAVENAIKLARQYQIEEGTPSKHLVVGRWQSYHGATIGTLAVGGHVLRRRHYQPLMHDAPHVEPAFCYRCPFGKVYESCAVDCARSLERTIRLLGPENVAAFIAEPVVGAALGAVPPPDEYFPMVREICDRYDVLLIADEVMTGNGRTGRYFALEHWGVVPDVIATAKGLSGGYAPLGAIIAREAIIARFEANGSSFVSAHTHAGNPVACAAGIAALKFIDAHNLIANAQAMGDRLLGHLRAIRDRHPMVGDVRGKGLMVGLELVRSRTTKEPFQPELSVATRVFEAALERGLITYPGRGTVDGLLGDHLKLAPPLVITAKQVDEVAAILEGAIAAVESELAGVMAAGPAAS
ncbi:MAG: aspartate aminotransferase family protein [Chloroflexi bacterium]|nr:aspartate aminotransferase family protein [Chloroflexota bacterium]